MKPLTVTYEHSKLLAVPAVHYSHIFAFEVNRICSNPETRPDAIAVELGPQAAAAAAGWIRELNIGSGIRNQMPLMLGITLRNRMIRSTFKDKAVKLQKQTGKDLSELPPKLLFEELGYTGASLLCLCPTDSIIEAIRCAVELGLPLYGVDLEEMANRNYPVGVIQDPLSSNADLLEYVTSNENYAERQRDDEIDQRREIAMSARLKTLLNRHRKVLFTCGLAHWHQIQCLIQTASIRPAILSRSSQAAKKDFKRVIVHPLLAIHHMDPCPSFVEAYEKVRKAPNETHNPMTRKDIPNAQRFLFNALRRAGQKYFHEGIKKQWEHVSDLDSLPAYENYLHNLSILYSRAVPNLFMAAGAAKEIMSRPFVEAVVNGLMDISWTSTKEYPECDLLAPAPDNYGRSLSAVYQHNGHMGEDHIFIRSLPNRSEHSYESDIAFAWNDPSKISQNDKFGPIFHTWSPWDNIITSLSLHAIDKASQKCTRKIVEPFKGSLLEGIDVKATVRSFSRGQEKIIVKDLSNIKSPCMPNPGDGFPVVWLLDPQAKKAEWIAMFEEFESMAPHIQRLQRFNHISETRGDKLVATSGFGQRDSFKTGKVRSDVYFGIVLFQPLSWTHHQFARWAELTNYRRNPICRDTLIDRINSDLKNFLGEKHGLRLEKYHWTTILILLAIPFARKFLPVVAPKGYKIDHIVIDTAQAMGIDIALVPISCFSKKELKRLSICQMVPAITTEPKCTYPSWVAKETGEEPTDYIERIPRQWLEFGM